MTKEDIETLKEISEELKSIGTINLLVSSDKINKIIQKYDTNLEDRQLDFSAELYANYSDKYDDSTLSQFYEYWTEHGKNDRKMRFEKEKSFDISRRLRTWQRNTKKFTNPDNKNVNQIWD